MRYFIRILMIGMAAIAQAAIAQTGTRFDNTPEVDAGADGMTFGQCLANYRPREADAWLATAPGTDASNAAQGALMPVRNHHCVRIGGFQIGGSQLMFSENILRGHVARGRYLALYPGGPPPSIADAAPSIIAVEIYNERVTSAADTESEIIRIFGDCMAAAEPVQVDAFVRTAMSTRAEAAAIGALQPAMGPCLWNGQTIAFSRESLRAALAYGLYRKAIAPPIAATTMSAAE